MIVLTRAKVGHAGIFQMKPDSFESGFFYALKLRISVGLPCCHSPVAGGLRRILRALFAAQGRCVGSFPISRPVAEAKFRCVREKGLTYVRGRDSSSQQEQ